MIAELLDLLPKKTRSLLINNLAHIYIELWPPCLDTHRTENWGVGPDKYLEIAKNIKIGDVILQHKNGYVANKLIPGYMSHAAIYVGEMEGFSRGVVHMVNPKIQMVELFEMTRCDAMEIWTPAKPMMNFERGALKGKVYELLDRVVRYDYSFIEGNQEYYCSELIMEIYKIFKDVNFFKSSKFGREYYEPDKFIRNSNSWVLRSSFGP